MIYTGRCYAVLAVERLVHEVLNAARALSPAKPVAAGHRPALHPVVLFRALVAAWVPLSLTGLLPYAQALLLLRLCAQRPPRSGGLRLMMLAWMAVSVIAGVTAWHSGAAGAASMWPMLAAAGGGFFVALAVSAGAAAGMRGPRFVRAVVWLGVMALVVACVRAGALVLHDSALADAAGRLRLFFPSLASAQVAGLGIAFIATREQQFRWRVAGMAGGVAAWLTGAAAATVAAGAIGAAVVLFVGARPVARYVLVALGAAAIAAWSVAAPMRGMPWAAALTIEYADAVIAGGITFVVLAARLMQARSATDDADAAVALGLAVCVTLSVAAAVPIACIALPCLFIFMWIGACAAPGVLTVPGAAGAGTGAQPPEASAWRALRPGLVQSSVRASSFQARAGRRN
jgi:hypothetical protein